MILESRLTAMVSLMFRASRLPSRVISLLLCASFLDFSAGVMLAEDRARIASLII